MFDVSVKRCAVVVVLWLASAGFMGCKESASDAEPAGLELKAWVETPRKLTCFDNVLQIPVKSAPHAIIRAGQQAGMADEKGKLTLTLPFEGFPVGAASVTVTAERGEEREETTVTFTRGARGVDLSIGVEEVDTTEPTWFQGYWEPVDGSGARYNRGTRFALSEAGDVEFRLGGCEIATVSSPLGEAVVDAEGATLRWDVVASMLELKAPVFDKSRPYAKTEHTFESEPLIVTNSDGSEERRVLKGTFYLTQLVDALNGIEDNGLEWAKAYRGGGEKGAPILLLRPAGGRKASLELGLLRDQRIGDAELVATYQRDYRSDGSCGPYGYPGKRVKRQRAINAVTVYEARTGKVVARKKFTGPRPTCPESVMSSQTTITGSVSAGTIEAWLTENF